MRTSVLWQGIVVSLVTLMVTLNVRVFLATPPPDNNAFPMDAAKGIYARELYNQPVIINIQSPADVVPLNSSFAQMKWLGLQKNQAKVIGFNRDYQSYLTIGVPSIKRINGMTYLVETISSLIDKTTTEDKTSVVILVFLADFDTDYNSGVIEKLTSSFMDYINMGFIQIVQVPKEFYPQLTDLKRNFNDDPERVYWRAKQVIDYAFLFLYAQNISQYYLQIEDDVMSSSNFVTSIKEYIKSVSTHHWAVLDFSELGFIGKLFKSEDLIKLARYMFTFYDEQPVDWLVIYFRLSMAQREVLLRKPTLFQHRGVKSSFDTSKDNNLKDRFFDDGEKPWKSDDPPATIVTNMAPFEQWMPALAYGAGSGYFWASKVKDGDWISLVFDSDDLVLDRIVIETGHPKSRKDTLINGTVEVSPMLMKLDVDNKEVTCANLRRMGNFESGRIDLADLDNRLHGQPTKCMRITVGPSQVDWIIFHQIAVYIKKKPS